MSKKKQTKRKRGGRKVDPYTGKTRLGQPYYLHPHIVGRLAEEQLEDYREAFCVFDSTEEGAVCPDNVKDIVRILGMKPGEDRLDDLVQHLHKNGKGKVEYRDFMQMMIKLEQEETTEETLRKAFGVFDEDGSGTIPVDVFRHMLAELANGFTTEEVNTIIEQANPDDNDLVHYEKIVKKLRHGNSRHAERSAHGGVTHLE